MSDELHECEYLKYKEWTVKLVHADTEYQRRALCDGEGNVVLQVVMFCPYCGEDFRADCRWQIPGRPEENRILDAARKAAEPEAAPVVLKSVERTIVGSRLNDRTWFQALFDGEPSEDDIAEAQSKAHYSPSGYGGPWKIKRTKNEDGTWTAEWCCAGSCD